MADSEPLVRVVAVPEAKDTLEDVNDLVDLVHQQPGSYGMIVCAQTLFFTMILMLFTVALDNDMQDQGLPSLVTIDLSKKAVTCKGGVPLTWKVGACTFFVGVACLEVALARRTKVGRELLSSQKLTAGMAVFLGFLDRYDSFSDIAFSLTADRCGSILGLYSLVVFGFGVIVMQILPAFYLLLTQPCTHLAMRFNSMPLMLELIDPTRGNLTLPDEVQDQATGKLSNQQQQAAATTGTAQGPAHVVGEQTAKVESLGKSPLDARQSPEEIAQIKSQVEQLSREEELAEADDPDSVKNSVFVARSKKIAGGIRFLCEDLLQGIFQVLFIIGYWEQLSTSTVVFTMTSVMAGLLVSMGGPLHALLKERENTAYYNTLPKLQDGVKFRGVNSFQQQVGGLVHSAWHTTTLEFNSVQRSGDRLAIKGKLSQQEVVRECDPASTDDERRHHLSPPFAACERVVVGTYDIQRALLELRTESIEVLSEGMAFDYLQYKLKVFPTCLKGIAEVQERTRGRVVQRMFGESVEVDFDPDSHSETVRLTLKRS